MKNQISPTTSFIKNFKYTCKKLPIGNPTGDSYILITINFNKLEVCKNSQDLKYHEIIYLGYQKKNTLEYFDIIEVHQSNIKIVFILFILLTEKCISYIIFTHYQYSTL